MPLEFPRKGACLESVFWREIHAVEFGDCIELPFPSRTVEWLIYHSTVHRLMKVRAASALLPTLFPSPTGSRLSPSSSHGAIHVMAQTGRSNARYVDPQRRYTVVLGPSWNAPFGALPHNDRAGTHDGADGRCGSYAPIGRGQAALWITSKNFVAGCSLSESGTSAAPPRSAMNSRRFIRPPRHASGLE